MKKRKMKKLLLTAVCMAALSVQAQEVLPDGYYRVQNKQTTNYIIVTHNQGGLNATTQTADLRALETIRGFDKVETDPASVIYIKKDPGGYRLKAQGEDTYEIVHYYMQLAKKDGVWAAYATESGLTKYLYEQVNIDEQTDQIIEDWSRVITPTAEQLSKIYNKAEHRDRRWWYINEVTLADGQYFGVAPQTKAGDMFYQTFYADFPFSFNSSSCKAYSVKLTDEALGVAVWEELSGPIAKGQPVIIGSPSNVAKDNKLNIGVTGATTISDNKLTGVYFNRYDYMQNIDNRVANDPATMRLLGTTSDGRLAFVKSDVDYIPRNTAYLTVSATAPDELVLMTAAEYADMKAQHTVTITARNAEREYGDQNPTLAFDITAGAILSGTPVVSTEANEQSPVGTYPIVVSLGTVGNRLATLVNGTLTVKKAPLTIAAGTYTKKQGEPMPDFTLTFTGFKNGETSDVLTTQPTISCEANELSAPGEYTITVYGAEAQNYDIAYTTGKLIVTEADLVTVTVKDTKRTYGDANPNFNYEVSGGTLQGTPEISCTATATSPVGNYDIVASLGTVTNPNVIFVAGKLTVEKATIEVTVDDCERSMEEPNPTFTLHYSGFKNGEDESVFTQLPVATTTATSSSQPGEYEITISGGEAQNYAFTYVPGTLTVKQTDAIHAVSISRPADVFTLDGRKVRANATTLQGLPRGVYVVNGRKVVF